MYEHLAELEENMTVKIQIFSPIVMRTAPLMQMQTSEVHLVLLLRIAPMMKKYRSNL